MIIFPSNDPLFIKIAGPYLQRAKFDMFVARTRPLNLLSTAQPKLVAVFAAFKSSL